MAGARYGWAPAVAVIVLATCLGGGEALVGRVGEGVTRRGGCFASTAPLTGRRAPRRACSDVVRRPQVCGSCLPVTSAGSRRREGAWSLIGTRMVRGEDECDFDGCPLDCVEEVLTLKELQHLTTELGTWEVTVSREGKIRERGPKLVVVEVYARDSLSSALARERYTAVCEKFGGNQQDVLFVKVPMDARSEELRQWAKAQGVKRLPFFILYKGGERIDHCTGREMYRGELSGQIMDNIL